MGFFDELFGVSSDDNKDKKEASNGHGSENWSEVMGGCDKDGNPVTVQFGYGRCEGQVRLGDGDRSEGGYRDAAGNVHTGRFEASANHDHYGDGRNDNGTQRGQYTGYGS